MTEKEKRRWFLANALETAISDRAELDRDIERIVVELAKECKYVSKPFLNQRW
jgi:hypothetical protein